MPTKAQYDSLLSSAGISNNSAGSSKIRGVPYSFPYAGIVNNGSLGGVGSWAVYWSSTAYGADSAYRLNFNSSGVSTNTDGRYFGLSVRCIAP